MLLLPLKIAILRLLLVLLLLLLQGSELEGVANIRPQQLAVHVLYGKSSDVIVFAAWTRQPCFRIES